MKAALPLQGLNGQPPTISMRYTLVDGHSVIFAWPELRKLHTRRTELARGELSEDLGDACHIDHFQAESAIGPRKNHAGDAEFDEARPKRGVESLVLIHHFMNAPRRTDVDEQCP